ncbi:hypothetical protein FOA52_002151 [Chlamydomonas sp. UWO 241]|nr:hypothetical protein FOA52_002151 [Chlamydomonas sp. UWO 241]
MACAASRSSLQGVTRAPSARAAPSSRRGAVLVVRAGDERKEGSSEEPSTSDWDGAWSSFKKNIDNTVDVNPGMKRGAPRKGAPRMQTKGEAQMRREESWLLDIWTNERVQQVGAVLSLVVFAIIISSVGPPPSDSRCTLPWC